jgi:DHA3 family macrolide efflux protein-like MFS transporter
MTVSMAASASHGAEPQPETAKAPAPAGFRSFLVLWAGQLVSILGNGLTGFGLGIWVYQQTGSVTRFGLISLFTTLPGILFSPFAGALADRWDRRRTLILADSGSGLVSLSIALLLYFHRLEIWHIYVLMGISSTCSALQWPAYVSATTLLVSKRDFSRAAGLRNLAQAASDLLAPMLGGLILAMAGIYMVLVVDFATFLAGIGTLLLVRIPKPQESSEGRAAQGSLLRETALGWTYVRRRSGLLLLLLLAPLCNLAQGTVRVLAAPMVLAFTSAAALGTALSIAGSGVLVGSLLMSAWRGPRRRVDGVLGFTVLCGLAMVLAGLRPSLVLFTIAGFLYFFGFVVSGTCGQALWQVKVDPDLQGRVSAVRRMVGWSTFPIAYAASGPLVDRVFSPMLMPGGALVGSVGRVLGIGPGRGAALLLICMGLLLVLIALGGYLFPRLRNIEAELPDKFTH